MSLRLVSDNAEIEAKRRDEDLYAAYGAACRQLEAAIGSGFWNITDARKVVEAYDAWQKHFTRGKRS